MIRCAAKQNLNDYKGALTDADSAVNIEPDNVIAVYNKAVLEYMLGDDKNAAADLKAVEKLNPQYAATYYYMAMMDIKAGYKDVALKELNKATELGFLGGVDTFKKYSK